MSILVVSDVHFEKGHHHGVSEFGAFEWLLGVVKRTSPAALIGLGDWGYAWSPENWEQLCTVVPVHALYGNHDNLTLLRSVKNQDGITILAMDGEVRLIEGLRFGFINGIIAEDKKVKEGIPRKAPYEFIECANRLVGVKVLCTHESPYLSVYRGRIHRSIGNLTVLSVIESLQPTLAVSGHLSAPYTAAKIGQTNAIRLESSQAEKHYAVIDVPQNQVTIWNDDEPSETVRVEFDER